MSGPAGSVEAGFEVDPQSPVFNPAPGAADTKPPPAWYHLDWDATKASAESAYWDVPGRAMQDRNTRLQFAAADLAQARGMQPGSYNLSMPGEPLQDPSQTFVDENAFWRDLRDYRRSNPQFLADLGNDAADFDRRRIAGYQADRASRGERMAKQGFVGNLAGGIAGSFTDPINVAAMAIPGGPAGKGVIALARELAITGIVNAGVETVETPFIGQERVAQGSELTGSEAMANIGTAFVGGVAFHGAAKAGGKFIVDPLAKVLKLDDRALAAALRQSVRGDWELTPQQAAAIHVLERNHEVESSNPFANRLEAVDAHERQLQATMEGLAAAPEPAPPAAAFTPTRVTAPVAAPSGGHLDPEVVQFFRAKGVTEAQARGIAAGIHAESGGRVDAFNSAGGGQGAYGLGQLRGPRLEALRQKFGDNPTKLQQLEHLWSELQGGDRGGKSVLAAQTEQDVLSAYVGETRADGTGWGFMRPSTDGRAGDLKRGMAALGRHDEALPGAFDAPDAAPAEIARPDALDAERPIADGGDRPPAPDLQVRPEVMDDGLMTALRPVLADHSISLRDTASLAADLGIGEVELRRGLERLVGTGELHQLKDGSYRRPARPGNAGPEDMVRFIARRGGLSYDGFSEAQRARNLNMDNPPRGHDLKNSGNLDHFVPGAGKLLRPTGKGLDEMGELLHDAGYFGPPESTPRPTEAELITMLDQVIGNKEKRYSFADQAPEAKRTPEQQADHAGFQSLADYEDQVKRFNGAAQQALGRDLSHDEFMAALAIKREFSDNLGAREDYLYSDAGWDNGDNLTPYVVEMANREIDRALDDVYLEIEDPYYDVHPEHDAVDGQGGTAAQGGDGSTPDAGNPRAGESGAGNGGQPDQATELSPADRDALEAEGLAGPVLADPATQARFDDPAGEGVKAVADSVWHDLRAGIERDRTLPKPQEDTRGGGVQYHGARGDLPDLSGGYYNSKNIYGGFETFYTTDAIDIAGGYERKKIAGKTYRVDEVSPVSKFNMEDRQSPEEIARLLGVTDYENAHGFPASAVEAAVGADGKVSLREAMDAVREQSSGEGYTRDDTQEIFDAAVYNLQQAGFGAMEHVGGLLTNKQPHRVVIYFDAPNQLRLTPLDDAKVGVTETVAPAALDNGRAVDPAVAAKQAQEAQLGAAAPLRGENKTGVAQDGTMGLPMFDAADAPKFDLGDGKGPRTIAEIDAELAAHEAGIDAIKGCML